MSLYLDLKVGESLDINKGQVTVTLEEKTGNRMRVKIDADRSIPVRKLETKTSRQIAARYGLRAIN